MVEEAPPIEQIIALALKPSNLNSVLGIMNNPIRQIAKVQLESMESLMASIIATEGDVNKVPLAAGAFLAERLEDPVKMARVIITNGMNKGGI